VLERLSGPDGAVVRERTRPVAEFAAEHAQAVDARRTALESRMLAWEVENPGQPWPNTLHEQLAETAVERARWARLADRIGADKAASGPLVPADRAATAEVEALRASDARAYLRALTTGKGGRALKASPELAHLRQRIAQGEEIRTTEDVRRVLDAFRAAPAAAQPTSNPDESVQAAPVPADRARPGVDVPQPRSAAPVLGALEPGADDLGRTDGQTSSGGAPRAQAPNEVTTDAGRGRETPVAEAADRQRAEDAGGRDTAERLGATAAASGRGVGSALGSAESERVRGSTAPSAGPAGESVAGFAAGTSGARARGEAGQAPPSPDPGADYAAFDALSVQVPMPGNDAGDAGARVYQAGPELRALDRRITDLRRVLACVSGAR
jgi:hypothetical protein